MEGIDFSVAFYYTLSCRILRITRLNGYTGSIPAPIIGKKERQS